MTIDASDLGSNVRPTHTVLGLREGDPMNGTTEIECRCEPPHTLTVTYASARFPREEWPEVVKVEQGLAEGIPPCPWAVGEAIHALDTVAYEAAVQAALEAQIEDAAARHDDAMEARVDALRDRE